MNGQAALTNAIYLLACVGIVFSLTVIISFILPLLDKAGRWFR